MQKKSYTCSRCGQESPTKHCNKGCGISNVEGLDTNILLLDRENLTDILEKMLWNDEIKVSSLHQLIAIEIELTKRENL